MVLLYEDIEVSSGINQMAVYTYVGLRQFKSSNEFFQLLSYIKTLHKLYRMPPGLGLAQIHPNKCVNEKEQLMENKELLKYILLVNLLLWYLNELSRANFEFS